MTSVAGARPADLHERMEANLAEHACHLHRRTDGMSVDEDGDVVIADSGLADDTFNIVAAARFTASGAGGRIAATVDKVLATGRPFAWWVGPASTPTDLPARLVAAGLSAAEQEAAMWADLSDVSDDPAVPGLEIRRAATVAELGDFASVVEANFTPARPTVTRFFAATARLALRRQSPAAYLVGFVDGRPVCSAEVFDHAGVAGVYNVCTRVEVRRRGYAGAMMRRALVDARERGGQVGVLQASDQGRGIYERLGFRTSGRFTEFSITG